MHLPETKQPRPSLLFTAERLDRLRLRISNDSSVAAAWQQLQSRAIQLLDTQWTDEALADRGGNQHGNYLKPARELTDLVQTLCLLHLLEPDERLAAKIYDGLLHYAGYRHWSGPGLRDRNPPWHSELVTSSFCFAYAMGYDVLRDRWTADERQRISGALADKGVIPILQDWLLPRTRIHALDSMGHNWWIVCLWMAGVGALSLLGDRPEAAGWVDEIEQSVPEWFGYGGNVLQNKVANFDSGGAFYEGVNYANYALMEYLIYRTSFSDALPNCHPAPCPQLRQAEQFFLHTFYPAGDGFLTVNFGDHRIANAGAGAMRLLLANGFASEAGKWYLERTVTDRAQPLALLLDDDAEGQPSHELPLTVLFPESSWAVMRSSWKDDATLLAARAGTFWNHAHADSGSFVLFHRGRPLIEDAGTCDYGRPEYGRYYITSRAHNVVLVDGQGAPHEDFLRGSKFPGRMHSLLDDAGLKYVYADATGPMAHLLSRHYRHWLWVDGAIIIFDDLLAYHPARFNWLLHHAGSVEREEQSLVIRNGPAEALVHFLHPGQLDAREITAPAPDDPDKQIPYLEFTTRQASLQQNFLVAIIPVDSAGEAPPQVRFIQGTEYLGARILGANTTTDVFFNLLADGRRSHENSNSVLEGWETDAYLLAVSRPKEAAEGDGLRRILMINGSYLRRCGAVLLASLSKVDALVIPDPKRPRVTIHGQPAVQLDFLQMTPPDEVVVNGFPVTFDYSPAGQRIRCKATSSGEQAR